MEPLPIYVPSTEDSRSFSIRGHGFYVHRGPSSSGFGFHAGGRDGDVVADDAKEPGILDELLAGIPGVRWTWGGAYEVAAPSQLDDVERRLRAASSPPYVSIGRTVSGDRAVAEQLFALPLPPRARRMIYVAKGAALTVRLEPTGDPIAELGAWGRSPGDLFEIVEARAGVRFESVGVDGRHLVRRIPAASLAVLLDEALTRIGVSDVRVSDSF